MPRRIRTFEDAMQFGASLPISLDRDRFGRPLVSRSEWERLPRWRRIVDTVFGGRPPKGYGERVPWPPEGD
jgi:hypothetical protein